MRRFVFRRDAGKCCVPTCRASRFLEIHHIVPRAEGGSHEPENQTLLCDGHHARHEGKLTITGKAPKLEVRWAHDPRSDVPRVEREQRDVADRDHHEPPTTHVGRECDRSRVEIAKLVSEAQQALVQLRFPKLAAREAVLSALDELGGDVPIDKLIFEAIRRCKP